MKNISKDTIIRTLILIVALANQVLAVFGKETLPFSDDMIYQVVSLVATVGSATWSWWKNNSFTPEAIEADENMRAAKAAKK